MKILIFRVMQEVKMFNMTKIRATNGAGKSFYANHLSANDYYSESEKIVGHWKGILSFEFGLITKEVDMDTPRCLR